MSQTEAQLVRPTAHNRPILLQLSQALGQVPWPARRKAVARQILAAKVAPDRRQMHRLPGRHRAEHAVDEGLVARVVSVRHSKLRARRAGSGTRAIHGGHRSVAALERQTCHPD